MKQKTLSALLAAVCSFGVAHYAAANDVQVATAADNAERFAYPHTRVFNYEVDAGDTAYIDEVGAKHLGNGQYEQIRHIKRDDAVEKYYGDTWEDPYRWLEDADKIAYEYLNESDEDRVRNHVGTVWENPNNARKLAYLSKVKNEESEINKWVDAQNAATADYLQKIPYYHQVKDNIDGLVNYYSAYLSHKTDQGELKFDRHTDTYWRLTKVAKDGSKTVLLDEKNLSADGSAVIVDGFFNDTGKYFVYLMREGNADSDDAWWHIIDTDSGARIEEIDQVGSTAKLLWKDDKSFYYLKGGHIKLHRIGSKSLHDQSIASGWRWDSQLNDFWYEADKRYLFVEGSWGGNENKMLFAKDLKNGSITRFHNQWAINAFKSRDGVFTPCVCVLCAF